MSGRPIFSDKMERGGAGIQVVTGARWAVERNQAIFFVEQCDADTGW